MRLMGEREKQRACFSFFFFHGLHEEESKPQSKTPA